MVPEKVMEVLGSVANMEKAYVACEPHITESVVRECLDFHSANKAKRAKEAEERAAIQAARKNKAVNKSRPRSYWSREHPASHPYRKRSSSGSTPTTPPPKTYGEYRKQRNEVN